MKIKITCPVPEMGFNAGLIYEVPDKIARELIEQQKAIELIPDEKPRKVKKEGDA